MDRSNLLVVRTKATKSTPQTGPYRGIQGQDNTQTPMQGDLHRQPGPRARHVAVWAGWNRPTGSSNPLRRTLRSAKGYAITPIMKRHGGRGSPSKSVAKSTSLVTPLRAFWQQLQAETGGSVSAPSTAGRSDDGFVLVWDHAEHHLDVDLLDDGTLEWFYSNRRTEFFEGQEGLPSGPALPEPILRYLKLIA